MATQFATMRLIDSVWTMEFNMVDGKAEIKSFNRTNPKGYQEERNLPQLMVNEGDDRIVREITVAPFNDHRQDFSDGEVLQVANPQHVFSYN